MPGLDFSSPPDPNGPYGALAGQYYAGGQPPGAYDVNKDPSYLAYQRALDNQGALAMTQTARRLEEANLIANRDIPREQENEQERQRGINNGFEARGVFRSGERLRRGAISQRSSDRRISDITFRQGHTSSLARENLQTQLADLARQKAERAFASVPKVTAAPFG